MLVRRKGPVVEETAGGEGTHASDWEGARGREEGVVENGVESSCRAEDVSLIAIESSYDTTLERNGTRTETHGWTCAHGAEEKVVIYTDSSHQMALLVNVNVVYDDKLLYSVNHSQAPPQYRPDL